MQEQPVRHEFTAVIEGIELPSDVVDRVARSVQKAVLVEIADIDLRGSVVLQIPSEAGIRHGGTQGIKVTRPKR